MALALPSPDLAIADGSGGWAIGALACGVAAVAAGATVALNAALRPLLARHALARPNHRSSHTVPTPQGGGIAVVAAATGIGGGALALAGGPNALPELGALTLATLLIAGVGALDDWRPLAPGLRLLAQAIAVALVLIAIPGGRLLPEPVPLAVERGLAVLAGIWFVNLVNFMDGIDWMTVAEMVPVAAAIVLFGALGFLPWAVVPIAAALAGGLLGFAPLNRPVARLFLGDVGSLPIGLLVAWMLYRLALSGGLAAAFLLPLYYAADATVTLVRRLAAREPVWRAHRTHYYQRATDNGLPVSAVVTHVFVLNLGLAALALATLVWPTGPVVAGALAAGCAAVAAVLRRFASPPAVGGARA